MKRKRAPERSTERTKQRLLDAAKRAFARHGFHGATVQQIAADAGVNVSLISYHFGGKEALYRACLSGFGAARLASLDRFLDAPRSIDDLRTRLTILVNELLLEHLAEPEIVAILLRDANDPDLWDKELSGQIFSFTTKLSHIFVQAKQRGLLREDADPLVAAATIYLAFSGLLQVAAHVERVSGLSLHDDKTRQHIVDKTLDLVFHGVIKP